jgi:hypothetical protein
MENEDITITLDNSMYTASDDDVITIDTSTWDNSFTTSPSSIYTTTGTSSITIGTDTSEFIYNTLDNYIDPDEVDCMCKEYPALSKVWTNFKSVYDMTLQDYKGKKEVGDLND